MEKSPKNKKTNTKQVLVVAQELKLARILAGNNKTARDRALKSLKKWFKNRSSTIPFTEDDFLRLWKGLFYSMWMSDKPLIQEECAENIANLVHHLPLEAAILFYQCGMRILMNEWFGIDQLRLDKFMMFVRRLLRQILFVLKNETWRKSSINLFTQCLGKTILEPKQQKPLGLLLHFTDIYLEELSKVTDGELPCHTTTNFLIPFIKELAFCDDQRIINHIKKEIFIKLIKQSDLGLEYDEKYKAWRSLGFPGTIDAMTKVELSDDEDLESKEPQEDVPLDPRAGRVDVELRQIKFNSKCIIKALSDVKFEKLTNSKSRQCIKELMELFRKLASGVYPLGIKKVNVATSEYDTNIRKAVNRLVKFEKKIKTKKDRKRKSEHEVTLRSGKKVKLDEDLVNKMESEFINQIKKKKRKIEGTTESTPKKPKKQDTFLDNIEVESTFKRNSGVWFVTKITDMSMEEVSSPLKEVFSPRNDWEVSSDDAVEKITKSLKKHRVSLPNDLLKNPFASQSAKKVKINTKLNMSQEVQEHVAQVLCSPQIPYDANKKPAKPLLKARLQSSPINPFY